MDKITKEELKKTKRKIKQECKNKDLSKVYYGSMTAKEYINKLNKRIDMEA